MFIRSDEDNVFHASSGRRRINSLDGLEEKAIFCHDKTGLDMLNILKGDMLITIGIKGLPGTAALEQEKAAATKILAHL